MELTQEYFFPVVAIMVAGVLLHVAIVQAALPQGIVPFVFAKEYNVHPDILSTGVIFGMLIALPITLVYYIVLGLWCVKMWWEKGMGFLNCRSLASVAWRGERAGGRRGSGLPNTWKLKKIISDSDDNVIISRKEAFEKNYHQCFYSTVVISLPFFFFFSLAHCAYNFFWKHMAKEAFFYLL